MRIDLYITISSELACILSRLQTINAFRPHLYVEYIVKDWGINDLMVIDSYHCETAEAVVVSYAEWSVIKREYELVARHFT